MAKINTIPLSKTILQNYETYSFYQEAQKGIIGPEI